MKLKIQGQAGGTTILYNGAPIPNGGDLDTGGWLKVPVGQSCQINANGIGGGGGNLPAVDISRNGKNDVKVKRGNVRAKIVVLDGVAKRFAIIVRKKKHRQKAVLVDFS